MIRLYPADGGCGGAGGTACHPCHGHRSRCRACRRENDLMLFVWSVFELYPHLGVNADSGPAGPVLKFMPTGINADSGTDTATWGWKDAIALKPHLSSLLHSGITIALLGHFALTRSIYMAISRIRVSVPAPSSLCIAFGKFNPARPDYATVGFQGVS